MNFRNSHLIKLKVDDFSKTKFVLFQVFFMVFMAFVFITASIIPGDETIVIRDSDCADDKVTELNRCSRWDLSSNSVYTSYVDKINPQSKFLLVQIQPSIKPDTIQGEGKFELKFDFDYSYEKIPIKKGKNDDSEPQKFEHSKEITVECYSKSNICDTFNLIYDANMVENTDIKIKIETRLTDLNRNLVDGFNLSVRLSPLLLNSNLNLVFQRK